jgi:hypothetical protein
MKFFNSCNSIAEVKSLYKKLAKENHPDLGGDVKTMQAINIEYAYVCALFAKGSGRSDEDINAEIRLSEEYREAIEKIIHLPDILIELVGNWIWVTGNTRPVKETLKAAGYHYAHVKVAWYFRNEMFKTRGSGAPLEKIRAKYGSETLNTRYRGKAIE